MLDSIPSTPKLKNKVLDNLNWEQELAGISSVKDNE
jgi:hypothetical protein